LAEAWADPSPVSLYIAKEETIHEDRYFMIDHYTVNRKLGIIYWLFVKSQCSSNLIHLNLTMSFSSSTSMSGGITILAFSAMNCKQTSSNMSIFLDLQLQVGNLAN